MTTLCHDYHVAVPTAFYEDETLNAAVTLEHIYHLYQKGVKSVLIGGSTGEQHSLSLPEKLQLLAAIELDKRLPDDFEIIFGISSIRQLDAVKLAEKVNESSKVKGVLLGFSPYILPSQQEAIAYVLAVVAKLSQKAVILYNNPRRTGFDLSNDSLITLLKNSSIIGIKEAGNPDKVSDLIKRGIDHIYFYAGGENQLKEKIAIGFNRLSSVAGNVYPDEIKNYFQALKSNNISEAEQIDIAKQLHKLATDTPLQTLKSMIAKNENIAMQYCRAPLGN